MAKERHIGVFDHQYVSAIIQITYFLFFSLFCFLFYLMTIQVNHGKVRKKWHNYITLNY